MKKILQIEGLDATELKNLLTDIFKNFRDEEQSHFSSRDGPPINTKEMLTQQAAAEYLGITPQTLISWRHQDLIKGYTMGRMVYFFLDEIHQAVKEGNVKQKIRN